VSSCGTRVHGGTWENGATLGRNGRLSIQRIVVGYGDSIFTEQGVDRAMETLRMAPLAAEFKRMPLRAYLAGRSVVT
jgi:hypothetical protein